MWHIAKAAGEDLIVSTTGKASRELFEIRETNGQSHGTDFLTVGSMGHSSSIALGIALRMPEKRVWVIDGDGAALEEAKNAEELHFIKTIGAKSQRSKGLRFGKAFLLISSF